MRHSVMPWASRKQNGLGLEDSLGHWIHSESISHLRIVNREERFIINFRRAWHHCFYMQLWRVGPCSDFWIGNGNIPSKYRQREGRRINLAVYVLDRTVHFLAVLFHVLYFHSKHTRKQNKKEKTEKQYNWIKYLPTGKHKSFTTESPGL